MDVNALVNFSTHMSRQQLALELDVAVAKKALEMQGSAVEALVANIDAGEWVSQAQALPDNLGNYVNTTA